MNALVLLALCTSLITGQVDASAGLENAKIFARIGDWENGVKYLEAYIIQNPTDAEARLLLAECYFNWPDMQTVGEQAEDKNYDRGRAQIAILANLDDQGFQMLLRGLRSDTRQIHMACFGRLGEMKDRRAVDELLKIAQEDAYKKWSAINTMVSIERDRERPDKRLVALLVSILDSPDSDLSTVAAAADRLADLDVKEALPQIEDGLSRAVAALPTAPEREVKRDFASNVVGTLDAIAVLSPEDLGKLADNLLNKMSRIQQAYFFEAVRGSRRLSEETAMFSLRKALTIVEADPGAWSYAEGGQQYTIGRFVVRMARDRSDGFADPGLKKQLHRLCDSPQAEVRMGVVRIIGTIGDEEALPTLLPRLQPIWLPVSQAGRSSVTRGSDGRQLVRLIGVGDRTGYLLPPRSTKDAMHVQGGIFAWGNAEPDEVWAAVKRIRSAATTEFLLEKLRSDDMAWVFAAARLLRDLGEGKAIGPLKERYSQIPTTGEDRQVEMVRRAIEGAYQTLSGQSLTEQDGEAAAGRRGMNSRGGSGGSMGTMRGRMRGGGGRGTTSTTGSGTSEESEE